MDEARIDRLVSASVHQAIADCLPLQLEFYETWLRPVHWRKGDLNRAALGAVLSFLRREGGAYADVMTVAGRYAAQWVYDDLPWRTRALGRRLQPHTLRTRKLLKLAARLVRGTDRASSVKLRHEREGRVLDITGSAFCEVREKASAPLCHYYAAAVEHLFHLDQIDCDVGIRTCQATGATSCTLEVAIGARTAEPPVRQMPVVHPRLPGGE